MCEIERVRLLNSKANIHSQIVKVCDPKHATRNVTASTKQSWQFNPPLSPAIILTVALRRRFTRHRRTRLTQCTLVRAMTT